MPPSGAFGVNENPNSQSEVDMPPVLYCYRVWIFHASFPISYSFLAALLDTLAAQSTKARIKDIRRIVWIFYRYCAILPVAILPEVRQTRFALR